MKKIITAIAAAGLAAGAWMAPSPMSTPATPGQNVIHSACLIQFLPENDGRPTLRGGSHACVGVSGVDITPDAGQLRVHQTVTNTNLYKVTQSNAFPDASLTERGITTGPSGGTGVTRFALYDSKLGRPLDLRNEADRERITCRLCDVWFYATHIDSGAGR